MAMIFDFSGWVTRNDLKCSDGRTIRHGAFADQDGEVVPLVWQHQHNDPQNVLGHVLLENRDEGVYGYAVFNDTPTGSHAKTMVQHGDVDSLSIYANRLTQQGGDVLHGSIREVSLVLHGANPGAYIDNVVMHGDNEVFEDSGIIYCNGELDTETPYELYHADDKDTPDTKSDDDETVKDVFDKMSEKQKFVLYWFLAQAMQQKETTAAKHSYEGGNDDMKTNVFDRSTANDNFLAHVDEFRAKKDSIFERAKQLNSFKAAFKEAYAETFLAHAEGDVDYSSGDATYGVDSIDWLFPDYKNLNTPPEFIRRDDSWVGPFLAAVKKSPFSRIKSMFADITEDEARAKGYTKGKKKIEEVFTLLKRTTAPTTIYKKQKVDRQDIVDITDFNLVNWLWQEMRMMLNEELARAILIGDGRSGASDDKIDPLCIRPVWGDDTLFTIQKTITYNASGTDPESEKAKKLIRTIIKSRKEYKGTGTPNLYTTDDVLTDMLLLEDADGRRLYTSISELATALRVKDIITVEVMENQTRTTGEGSSEVTYTLAGILLNPVDYQVGTTRGGEITTFDDFDIDYNQYKYLMEARCSGALIKPKSAVALEFTTAA